MRALQFVLSLGAFFVLWALVAVPLHSNELPTPWAVADFILEDTLHGTMAYNIAITFLRATVSFLVAMVVGCGLGFVFGRSERADAAFMPWVLLIMNTPVLVIAALSFIWLGFHEATAVVAVVLAKFPNNTIIVRDGVRSFDPGLDDIGRIYRFSFVKRFLHILLPQSMPFVIAAARSGIGIVWKIVLVVELFGIGSGVGMQIQTHFSFGEVKGILGYSIAFSLVMLAVEFLILQPLDNYARRWRTQAA